MPSLPAYMPDTLSIPLAQHAALQDSTCTYGTSFDLPSMSVPSDQKHLSKSCATSKWAGGMNATSLQGEPNHPTCISGGHANSWQINKRLDHVKLVNGRLVFQPSSDKWQEKANEAELANNNVVHQPPSDISVASTKIFTSRNSQQLNLLRNKQESASGQVPECSLTQNPKRKPIELQPETSNLREADIHAITTDSGSRLVVPHQSLRFNPHSYKKIFSAAGMETNMSAATVLPESKSPNIGASSSKPVKKLDVGRYARRSSKWATPAELRGERGVEQNVDTSRDLPNHGFDRPPVVQRHELQDWTGNWGAPPVEWENRESYVEPLIADRVNNWQHTCALLGYTIDIGNSGFTIDGDIAPRVWKQSTIEGAVLDTWYCGEMPTELEKLDPAEPLCTPWWYSYATDHAEHLLPLDVPLAHLDPEDNDMSKALQQTSEHTLLSNENQKLRKAVNERKAKAAQRALEKELAAYVPPPNKHAPNVNLYIRPTVAADMPQIREIWNHYIEKTIFCPEMQPLTATQVRVRWEDIIECNLPFIVAVDASSKGNRRHGLEGHGRVRSEPLLGFAFADDHNDIKGMYRYTVEIDVFVKPSMLRKGVGRCLLDKVMSILDPCYDIRGGYDFVSDEMRYTPGGKRLIGSIIVNIPYDTKNKNRGMWMQQWLSGWDFEQAGELFDVGHKLNTIVSQIILIRKTGSTIHAWAL